MITCLILLQAMIGNNMHYTPKYIPCQVIDLYEKTYQLNCANTIAYIDLDNVDNKATKHVDVNSCNPTKKEQLDVNGRIFNKLLDRIK